MLDKNQEEILSKEEFIRLKACEIVTNYYKHLLNPNNEKMGLQFTDLQSRIKSFVHYIEKGYFD